MDNMDKTVIVAIISAAVAIVVAIISAAAAIVVKILGDRNTKRQEREDARAAEKLNHYKVLLSSLSDMSINKKDRGYVEKFALASNTIALVAPQNVVDALLNYIDLITGISDGPIDPGFVKLILEIRKDIGIFSDDEQTFRYKLVQYAAPETTEKLS